MKAHDVRKLCVCVSCKSLTDHPVGPQGETDGPPQYCVPCFVRSDGVSGLNRLDAQTKGRVNLSDLLTCGLGLADSGPLTFRIREPFIYNRLRGFNEFEGRVSRVQRRAKP